MNLEYDGPLGSRLRALDVPVPPGLGGRVAAPDKHRPYRRGRRLNRPALAAGAVAGLLVANTTALYVAPVYALALAHAPIAGGPSGAILAAVGLSASDGTMPIGSTATAAGQRVTIVEGTADELRTVLLLEVPVGLMIPPDRLTVTDQFGRVYSHAFAETSSSGGLTQRSLSSLDYPGATSRGIYMIGGPGPRNDPHQLALVLPPVKGEAAQVGARLTVRIDELASNTDHGFVDAAYGPWTLTASLVVQAATGLSLPPAQAFDGTTSRLTDVRAVGGVLEVRGSADGPAAQELRDMMSVGLQNSTGRTVRPIYGEWEYEGSTHSLQFDYTFRRPEPGVHQLKVGPVTFPIVVPADH